jgi:hypothetical protein
LVNVAMLVAIGYDPALESDKVQVTTGSGVEFAPRVELRRMTALGRERYGLQVLGHTLPPGTGVDGLMGLDFFWSPAHRLTAIAIKPTSGYNQPTGTVSPR